MYPINLYQDGKKGFHAVKDTTTPLTFAQHTAKGWITKKRDMRLIGGRHISFLCSDFEEMQPYGLSVWIVISEKFDGGFQRVPLWHTTFETKV